MANLSGSWRGTYWQGDNPTRFEITLVQGGNNLSGNILDDSHLGEASLTGEVVGRRISFLKHYLTGSCHNVNYQGTIAETEDFMSGEWNIGKYNSGNWEASRQKDDFDFNLALRRLQKVPALV